jgi:hypothetical protein
MQDVIFTTAGDGYWSTVSKTVRITDMRLGYVSDEEDFAELCVYFNTEDWDVDKDGLIYTDGDFIFELRLFLEQHGLVGSGVDYSEQGMQGDDYVSCDVGKAFLDSWKAKFNLSSVAYKVE